jgi:hypothetical protein
MTELQQDACQETGHAIGMGHHIDMSSCMYGTIDPNASRYPANGDWLMLENIYSGPAG